MRWCCRRRSLSHRQRTREDTWGPTWLWIARREDSLPPPYLGRWSCHCGYLLLLYHYFVERGLFRSILNNFVAVWQCGGGNHPSSRWWPRHLNPGIGVQSGYHQHPLSPSWRNVLIEFFSSQMRGGPEPLMVTGWAQIVSLDPSYRWRLFEIVWDCVRLWDGVRLREIVSLDPSYRWEAFH